MSSYDVRRSKLWRNILLVREGGAESTLASLGENPYNMPFRRHDCPLIVDDEYATSIFVPCSHGEGVTVRPDGLHELSPHTYKLTQKLRNVTVEILTCETCGDVSIAWCRQDDTEEVTDK